MVTPQLLLLTAVAGILLGALAVLLGLGDLAHRNRIAGHGQPLERDDAIGTVTRPGRW